MTAIVILFVRTHGDATIFTSHLELRNNCNVTQIDMNESLYYVTD